MRDESYLRVGTRILHLSRLEKIYYPETGFKKKDVLLYYRQIAPVLLPHLKSRPLTLKRYPEGVQGDYFYEKRCPSYRPPWFNTVEHTGIKFCDVGDLASLVWIVNLGSLELHTSLSRAPRLEQPSTMVFDLDPGAPAGIHECAQVALKIRSLLDDLNIECFPKTSGSKGLQLYVPLKATAGYLQTKSFARAIAEHLEREIPELVVSRMIKKIRAGRVFIDWSQNDVHKTTVCVYSLRATPLPSASTPLEWLEVEQAAKGKSSLFFSPADVLKRVSEQGDLFRSTLTLQQDLPTSARRWLKAA
ncbi:MAG: ATP-dependent DNA ligase [Bdellovibrionales bacterium GWB1_55_8]|nr:MAG: ATP-dependent DNA ligase [Bdellovibrionales bacterium GWB1_55_8]